MLGRLVLLFIFVASAEAFILIELVKRMDWLPTFMLIVVTGAIGASLAKREGLRVWSRMQEELAKGVPPAQSVLEGVLILMAAAVLITPGLITDAAGFCLLVPAVRALIGRRLAKYFEGRVMFFHSTMGESSTGRPEPRPAAQEDIIDVEATAHDASQPNDSRLDRKGGA